MTQDSERFRILYETNQKDIYYYLLKSVRDENLAVDLLQDTFLNFIKMFKEKPEPTGEHGRMYLFRIARNITINHVRKSNRNRTFSQGEEISAHESKAIGPEHDVVEKIEEEREDKILGEILSELPEEMRTAIILRHIEEFRLEDISEIIGLSVSRISRLLQKAERMILEEGKKRGIRGKS